MLSWVRLCVCVCVCVCLSVCLSVCPRGYLRNHTHDLYQICMHVAHGHGPVVLQQRDEIPRGRGNFWGFLPHWQCIVQHSIWDLCKNGWTDRDAVWDDEWAWPKEQCVMRGWRSPKGNGQFWENICPTSLIPLIIIRIRLARRYASAEYWI